MADTTLEKGTAMTKRCERNPILTRKDIPAISPHLTDVTSVFNPGAVKFKSEYLLMLRVQCRSTGNLSADCPESGRHAFHGVEGGRALQRH